ncbi:MAG: hypothetical protein WB715_22000 [Roseiarcus sp.]
MISAAQFALAGASLLAIPIVAIRSSAVADAALVDLGAIAECDIQEAACPDEDYQQFELQHDEHWRLSARRSTSSIAPALPSMFDGRSLAASRCRPQNT